MSRTPAAHLAGLKLKYPEWRFERIDAGNIRPDTGEEGFLAVRRDDPAVLLFAMSVDLLEVLVAGWRPPGEQPGRVADRLAERCMDVIDRAVAEGKLPG